MLAPEGLRELMGRDEKGQIGTQHRTEFCSRLALFKDETIVLRVEFLLRWSQMTSVWGICRIDANIG